MQIPPELELLRERAARAIAPLKPFVSNTDNDSGTLYLASRTHAGRDLPPYYLVYFLLVELLGFKNAGQFEKVAWSIAVDWNGRGFLIEHRKMGIGLFAQDLERDEEAARQIVHRVKKAVSVAEPFFEWMAGDAIARSAVNVRNNASTLYERYLYLRNLATEKRIEYKRSIITTEEIKCISTDLDSFYRENRLRHQLLKESKWLLLSAVEAFFAWTEHVFIHIALLTGRILTAAQVADIARGNWAEKFKSAFDISNATTKTHYDLLLLLREDLRNYIVHGAFGKQGEAFTFHSGAGAVPVLLPHQIGSRKFKFEEGMSFDLDASIVAMDNFVDFLWSGVRAPAKIYIQDCEFPAILNFARDGTYARAMTSSNSMDDFVEYLNELFDRSANMDW